MEYKAIHPNRNYSKILSIGADFQESQNINLTIIAFFIYFTARQNGCFPSRITSVLKTWHIIKKVS